MIAWRRGCNIKIAVLGSAISVPSTENVMIIDLEGVLILEETILRKVSSGRERKCFINDSQEQFKTSVEVAVNSDSIIMDQHSARKQRKQSMVNNWRTFLFSLVPHLPIKSVCLHNT